MSTQIQTILVDQFRATLDVLVQQKESRLREAVTVETVHGKRAAFDQIGVVSAVEVTTRHADTPYIDTPHGRRWLTVRDFVAADLLDNWDKAKLLADPASDYAQNFGRSMNRQIDDLIIEAATAVTVTGETGSGTEAFDTTNQQFGTGSAITLSKILQGVELLRAAEVDPNDDPITVVMPMRFMRILLLEAPPNVSSSDYNTVRALMTGEVKSFLGINWILSERIPLVGSERNALMFSKSGIKLGLAADIETRMDELPGKNYAVQVWSKLQGAAVRMENRRVVRILANS